jgi:hypothetical protein
MMTPIFELMEKLAEAGALSTQAFSVNPRPMDKAVPANLLQRLVFKYLMYSEQENYEKRREFDSLMRMKG